MTLTHPPKNATQRDMYKYHIGEVMKLLTDLFISQGIEFYPDKSECGFRNDIIHMGVQYHDGDVYKLCFHPAKTLSIANAKYITSLFCCHDDYTNVDINNDVVAPKEWVDYLTFQASITNESIPHDDGVLGERFIVQFRLYGGYMLILDNKINKLLCG